MKRGRWQLALAAFLVSLSGILYLVHYLLFRDAHSIGFYIVLELAFVPVNTLIVTLFIEQLLVQREKRLKMKKLNMVIGAFFSNVGVQLLKALSRSDSEGERIEGRADRETGLDGPRVQRGFDADKKVRLQAPARQRRA